MTDCFYFVECLWCFSLWDSFFFLVIITVLVSPNNREASNYTNPQLTRSSRADLKRLVHRRYRSCFSADSLPAVCVAYVQRRSPHCVTWRSELENPKQGGSHPTGVIVSGSLHLNWRLGKNHTNPQQRFWIRTLQTLVDSEIPQSENKAVQRAKVLNQNYHRSQFLAN